MPIFSAAVKKYLPSAIPAKLDKIDEYSIGKVLIHTKKPRKLIPMRKHGLDFTGWSLQNLLAEKEELTITTAKSYLYDTGKSTSTKAVNVGGDLDLETALTKLAGADFNFKAGETKNLTIVTDFGKVTHISTDLIKSVVKEKVQVRPDHPVVKRAIENGGVMFVITEIFQAEHCNLSVSLSESVSESGSADVAVEVEKTEGSERVGDKHSSVTVVNRDEPTTLAYLLLKVRVDSKGVISTQLNTRLSDKVEKKKGTKTQIKTHASDSGLDPYQEWVVIDIQTLKTSEAEPSQAKPQSEISRDQGQVTAKVAPVLGASASGVSEAQKATSEVSYPYPTPLSEIPSAKVDKPKTVGATEPLPIQGEDFTDYGDNMPDEHYLYSLKDFQPFESTTYRGILDESKNWVKPFVTNTKLQEAFLDYTKPPHTYERLNELSEYFLEVGNAMRSKKPPPPNTLKKVDPIISALSEDNDRRLDEITSVVVVAEAADEFAQHIVQKIIALPADKRRLLMDVILTTPYGHSRHVSVGEGPFNDPALKPIMSRMGFSIPSGTHDLLHARNESDEEEDRLAAGLILLLASEK